MWVMVEVKREKYMKRMLVSVLILLLIIISIVILYRKSHNSIMNEIDVGNISYCMVSYQDRYQKIEQSKAEKIVTTLQNVCNLRNARLTATNGMVLLTDHKYQQVQRDDFSIEIVFSKPQKVILFDDSTGQDSRVEKQIYGIFYSPDHDENVIDFCENEDRNSVGDYSMEYKFGDVNKDELGKLREQIKSIAMEK